jgi:hypothetical protein
MAGKPHNLAGRRFGPLIVLRQYRGAKWLCHCACGCEVLCSASDLVGRAYWFSQGR